VAAPVLLWFDYAAGPDTQLPAVYVLPVCVAAWYSGKRAAVGLAVAISLAHLMFMLTLWGPPANVGWVIGTTALRATVVAFIALVFARQSEHERQLRRDLERRHALELRTEQLRVVQVTMRTVQDIVNNNLNQLQILRLEAEGHVPDGTLVLFDATIQDTAAQLAALANMEVFAEKRMASGPALDVSPTLARPPELGQI
jgi:hypothetical protein